MRASPTLLWLSATLLVAACVPRHPYPDELLTDPEPLLQWSMGARQGLANIVADARVEYYGRDGARKGAVALVVSRPNALRFEALTPTGDTLGLLVSDGVRFTSFQRGDDACYVGPACPENVGRLLPLPLPTEAVVSILLGEAPLIAYELSEVTFNRRTGLYDVTLHNTDDETRQTISIAPADGAVHTVVLHRGSDTVFRVDFDAFQRHGDVRLPGRIRFRMPRRRVDLSLEYRDLERDLEGIGPDMFRFACPKGTTPIPLRCD